MGATTRRHAPTPPKPRPTPRGVVVGAWRELRVTMDAAGRLPEVMRGTDYPPLAWVEDELGGYTGPGSLYSRMAFVASVEAGETHTRAPRLTGRRAAALLDAGLAAAAARIG